MRMGARVVTSDRLRDRAEAHPAVTEAGFLVGGRVVGVEVRLRLWEGAKVA